MIFWRANDSPGPGHRRFAEVCRMIGAKPIEAGCRAIIIDSNSKARGKEVTVLFKIIDDAEFYGYWATDLDVIKYGCPPYVEYDAKQEHSLLRIDDPDIQNQIESEREKVHVLTD